MKKFTKLMLTLVMLVVGVGGMNALTLNATFSTPAPNGSWNNNIYSWTAGNNNLMTIFEFPNGELANYTSIHLTTANLTGEPYRICFMNGSTAKATIAFYSAGQKDINFADRDETKNLDMSTITHISFGGNSNAGSVTLTNAYLEGPDPLYHEVYALGSPITFEDALASTTPFVLVQNGKVLCGPLSVTDGSLTFKNVSEISDYSWTIKFEEDAVNKGSYFMELFNSNGGSKGFINASVWSHTYLSGVNKETSKGEKQDGALWTITSAGNGKYTIRNLGVSEGNYNNVPNGNEGDRVARGEGYLAITTNGYWENHVTHYNTSGEWEFYTLTTSQQTANDPVYFGWDEMSFSNDANVIKDDETHLVVDKRDWAPYWAETASWKFGSPFDASAYRYLVFYAKRNISKYGNDDSETGGTLFIKDSNNVTFRQDDYDRYKKEGDENAKFYPNISGSMWMNRWGDQRAKVIDLQWLANTDKYGDGSECKVLDITKITEIGIGGSFTIGGIYFTNTKPEVSAGDYRRTFDSFDKFGTICLPFTAVCCGAQLYEIVSKSDNGISLAEYEGIMEAGKPYMYKTLEAKKGDMNNETDIYFFKAGYKKANAPIENNGLIGTFSEMKAPTDTWVLSNNKLYTVNSEVTVGANKAWIVPNKVVNNGARGTKFIAFDEATGIKAVSETLNAGKMYDLSGREVSHPTKGIYVVNGKKVIIK